MVDFPSEYDSASDSPGFLLWQVTNLWQRQIKLALEEVNLTHVQFVLLASLAYLTHKVHLPNITQVQLAHHAQTDVMMTSQVLRTLEEKGLVQRQPSLTDTRAKNIALTPAGQEVIVRALKLVEQSDARFFAPLGDKSARFNRALRKLLVTIQ